MSKVIMSVLSFAGLIYGSADLQNSTVEEPSPIIVYKTIYIETPIEETKPIEDMPDIPIADSPIADSPQISITPTPQNIADPIPVDVIPVDATSGGS